MYERIIFLKYLKKTKHRFANFVSPLEYLYRKLKQDAAKNFDFLAIKLSILYNYFDKSIKFIFRSAHLVKFLDISTKIVLLY